MALALLFLTSVAACRQIEARQTKQAKSTMRPSVAATRVDSVLPVAEALQRFRADLPDEPATLGDASDSQRALVQRLVDVVERGDTLAIATLVLTRAEFAYLYYPGSPLAAPPYELAPALMWFQLQENNRDAALALLGKLGGARLGYAGHQCSRSEHQGTNIVWSDCYVALRQPDGAERRERLFGAIIERDGRHKFVSLRNELQ
jgi:hypothetical protein